MDKPCVLLNPEATSAAACTSDCVLGFHGLHLSDQGHGPTGQVFKIPIIFLLAFTNKKSCKSFPNGFVASNVCESTAQFRP